MTWDNETQFHRVGAKWQRTAFVSLGEKVMPHSWKGVIAGFVATVVLSALIMLFNAMGVLPQLDIVSLIDRLGSIGRTAAWVDHFIAGVLLWGPIYAGFDATTDERRPRWQRGLLFGVITWLAMMIIFMPVVGGGLFGLQIGIVEPIGMLFMNLVYGLVMALTFDFLDKQYPAKAPVPAAAAAKD
jgi:hypothetical protein